MKQAPIVQFNCFSTQLDQHAFMHHWDHYAETETIHDLLLLKLSAETKGRFQYISRQRWEQKAAERKPARHFQEATIKMVSAGGYALSDTHQRRKEPGSSIRLLAFLNINEIDIEPYVLSPLYTKLNVYQAWYESCLFSYVLDFNVPASCVEELKQLLQTSRGVEIGIYKECLVAVM